MRVDSIRVALRSNSSCTVQRYVDGLDAGAPVEPLAFANQTGPALRTLTMPSGSVMRASENERLDPGCEREAASDFEGAIGLPTLLWQGDLPGLGTAGAMYVRDLGPERNARLIARFPERTAMALLSREGRARLVPYDEGMRQLWPSAPGS